MPNSVIDRIKCSVSLLACSHHQGNSSHFSSSDRSLKECERKNVSNSACLTPPVKPWRLKESKGSWPMPVANGEYQAEKLLDAPIHAPYALRSEIV